MKTQKPRVRKTQTVLASAAVFEATRMVVEGNVNGAPAKIVKDFPPIRLFIGDSLQLTFNWAGFDH